MVGIVVGLLLLALVVFSIVRGVQWMTKKGPYNTYGVVDGETEQDRRDLRAEIRREQQGTGLTEADLENPWREGEEFGPQGDGSNARR